MAPTITTLVWSLHSINPQLLYPNPHPLLQISALPKFPKAHNQLVKYKTVTMFRLQNLPRHLRLSHYGECGALIPLVRCLATAVLAAAHHQTVVTHHHISTLLVPVQQPLLAGLVPVILPCLYNQQIGLLCPLAGVYLAHVSAARPH